ncbi:MAG: sugar kinase [Acidothermaceae bacterium]
MDDASAAPAIELVTVGETMGVVAADEIGPLRNGHRMLLGIAGAESNVAIGVSRLGHHSAWVGRVGADPIGSLVVRELRAESVDVSRVVVDPEAANGFMLKSRRTTATSQVNYLRRDSAGSRLCTGDIPADLVAGARLLHVTGITAALSTSAFEALRHVIAVARSAGVTVSFDVNHRSALWSETGARTALHELVPLCDVLFASENEAALLLGDSDAGAAALALSALGPHQVVVKRGELGYTACIDGEMFSDRAIDVPVADPVGAGDAFVAGYLASWLDGAAPAEALRTANAAGAFVVAVPGDWEGLPTRAELVAFENRTDAVTR